MRKRHLIWNIVIYAPFLGKGFWFERFGKSILLLCNIFTPVWLGSSAHFFLFLPANIHSVFQKSTLNLIYIFNMKLTLGCEWFKEYLKQTYGYPFQRPNFLRNWWNWKVGKTVGSHGVKLLMIKCAHGLTNYKSVAEETRKYEVVIIF